MAQSSFPESDNPIEFLYLDRHRVSSLIGQLSDKGVLTGLKSVVSKTATKEAKAGAGLPKMLDVAGTRGRVSFESAEETYDPFWTNAFSFLRDLEENFAVPLASGRLGSLVKFQALLQFIDLRIMKSLWGPLAEAEMRVVGPTAVGTRKQRREQKQMPPEMKLGLEVIKELPHLLHMTFLARENETIFRLWAAMKQEFLTLSSDDLAMKYGATIDGFWTTVGIIDARIGESPAILKTGNQLIDNATQALANFRNVLGRPTDHWGLTPIAIYKPLCGIAEVQAAAESAEPLPDVRDDAASE